MAAQTWRLSEAEDLQVSGQAGPGSGEHQLVVYVSQLVSLAGLRVAHLAVLTPWANTHRQSTLVQPSPQAQSSHPERPRTAGQHSYSPHHRLSPHTLSEHAPPVNTRTALTTGSVLTPWANTHRRSTLVQPSPQAQSSHPERTRTAGLHSYSPRHRLSPHTLSEHAPPVNTRTAPTTGSVLTPWANTHRRSTLVQPSPQAQSSHPERTRTASQHSYSPHHRLSPHTLSDHAPPVNTRTAPTTGSVLTPWANTHRQSTLVQPSPQAQSSHPERTRTAGQHSYSPHHRLSPHTLSEHAPPVYTRTALATGSALTPWANTHRRSTLVQPPPQAQSSHPERTRTAGQHSYSPHHRLSPHTLSEHAPPVNTRTALTTGSVLTPWANTHRRSTQVQPPPLAQSSHPERTRTAGQHSYSPHHRLSPHTLSEHAPPVNTRTAPTTGSVLTPWVNTHRQSTLVQPSSRAQSSHPVRTRTAGQHSYSPHHRLSPHTLSEHAPPVNTRTAPTTGSVLTPWANTHRRSTLVQPPPQAVLTPWANTHRRSTLVQPSTQAQSSHPERTRNASQHSYSPHHRLSPHTLSEHALPVNTCTAPTTGSVLTPWAYTHRRSTLVQPSPQAQSSHPERTRTAGQHSYSPHHRLSPHTLSEHAPPVNTRTALATGSVLTPWASTHRLSTLVQPPPQAQPSHPERTRTAGQHSYSPHHKLSPHTLSEHAPPVNTRTALTTGSVLTPWVNTHRRSTLVQPPPQAQSSHPERTRTAGQHSYSPHHRLRPHTLSEHAPPVYTRTALATGSALTPWANTHRRSTLVQPPPQAQSSHPERTRTAGQHSYSPHHRLSPHTLSEHAPPVYTRTALATGSALTPWANTHRRSTLVQPPPQAQSSHPERTRTAGQHSYSPHHRLSPHTLSEHAPPVNTRTAPTTGSVLTPWANTHRRSTLVQPSPQAQSSHPEWTRTASQHLYSPHHRLSRASRVAHSSGRHSYSPHHRLSRASRIAAFPPQSNGFFWQSPKYMGLSEASNYFLSVLITAGLVSLNRSNRPSWLW